MNGQDGATALLRAAEIGADGETLLALLDHCASPNVATEVLLIASISKSWFIYVPFVHFSAFRTWRSQLLYPRV